MFKIKCACGETEKSFKFDVGGFFVNDECCLKNGYDELGRLTDGAKAEKLKPTMSDKILDIIRAKAPTINIVPEMPKILEQSLVESEQLKLQEPSKIQKVLDFFRAGNPLSKSKLKDLKLEDLRKVAADREVSVPENTTRQQLLDLLLRKQS